jgi:hypothetical protein
LRHYRPKCDRERISEKTGLHWLEASLMFSGARQNFRPGWSLSGNNCLKIEIWITNLFNAVPTAARIVSGNRLIILYPIQKTARLQGHISTLEFSA